MGKDIRFEVSVNDSGNVVTAKGPRGLTFIFEVQGFDAKLKFIVVNYAWAFPSMSQEEVAKHVYTYTTKTCPVVLEGLTTARKAVKVFIATY